MGETIRILIVDDHAIVREGLRALIGGKPDMEVVGEAADTANPPTGHGFCRLPCDGGRKK